MKLLGMFNSFCDIPQPQSFESKKSAGIVIPQIGAAYAVIFPETKSYLVLWITDESHLMTASIVLKYKYYHHYIEPTEGCVPVIHRIDPPFVHSQGSIINIQGDHFGMDTKRVSVLIGDKFSCEGVEMVISDSVIRCHASGEGIHLPVQISVGKKSSQATGTISFQDTCKIKCPQGTHPDRFCEHCIGSLVSRKQVTRQIDTSNPESIVDMDTVLSDFLHEFLQAQYEADCRFKEVADRYRFTDLEVFPIPRYSVSDVQIELKFAIAESNPLRVFVLTEDLEQMDNAVISTMSFNISVPNEIRWIRVGESDAILEIQKLVAQV